MSLHSASASVAPQQLAIPPSPSGLTPTNVAALSGGPGVMGPRGPHQILKPSPTQPFGEYVVANMFLGSNTLIAQIASCCATLYLTRSDPTLLKELTEIFADEFPKEKKAILQRISDQEEKKRRRSQVASRKLRNITNNIGTDVSTLHNEGDAPVEGGGKGPLLDEAQHDTGSAQPNSSDAESSAAAVPTDDSPSASVSSIDQLLRQNSAFVSPDEIVEFFLAMVHQLVTQYFCFNWDQVERVIAVNKMYIQYVQDEMIGAVRRGEACTAQAPFFAPPSPANESLGLGLQSESSDSLFPAGSSQSMDHLVAAAFLPAADGFGTAVAPEGRDTPSVQSELPSNASPTGALFFVASPMERHRSTSMVNVTEDNFAVVARRCQDLQCSLVILFHAPFSEPSCAMWNVFEALRKKWWRTHSPTTQKAYDDPFSTLMGSSEPPMLGVVHGITELELVRDFHVEWYPTVILIPKGKCVEAFERIERLQLGSSTTATIVGREVSDCSLQSPGISMITQEGSSDGTQAPVVAPAGDSETFLSTPPPWERFPEKGLVTVEAVEEWILGDGKVKAKQRKFKAWVTHIRMLTAQLKFKPYRELHSACVMLRRLQCLDDECEQRAGVSADDPPLFVFLGGGMAAGKTTAATALARSDWWNTHKDHAVVVDADVFKAADPLFSIDSADIHKKSTKYAEQLLVHAINQGRSIIFDGTMMWQPFVEQTVAMIRNCHLFKYRLGPGYIEASNVEEYWVKDGLRERPLEVPYRIHLLAITVEPSEAVPRGILRRLSTGRAVPIQAQLRSFRLFSKSFSRYLELCDEVTLYNNNVRVDLDKGELPPVILSRTKGGDVVVEDQHAYDLFQKHKFINEKARSKDELFYHHLHHHHHHHHHAQNGGVKIAGGESPKRKLQA